MHPRAVAGRVFLALIALVVVVIAVAAALERVAAITGIGWLAGGNPILILVAALIVIPARYRYLPIPFKVSGTAEIKASPAEIWPRVLPRPGNPYHGPTIAGIEALPGAEDEVYFRLDDRLADDRFAGFRARILDEIPERKVVLTYPDAHELPFFAQDVVRSETCIEPLGRGWSRVTFTEYLRGLRVSTLLIFFHLNPARDAARRLKALCEGSDDPSWMGRTVRETGPDGEPPESVRREVRIGLGAVLVFSALLLGAVYLLIAKAGGGG